LGDFLRGATIDQIIRQSGMVDVYIISANSNPRSVELAEALGPTAILVNSCCSAGGRATPAGSWAATFLDPTSLVFFYFLAVMAAIIPVAGRPS
jgi:hypothetical protein